MPLDSDGVEVRDQDRAPAIRSRPGRRWFHGSPLRLEFAASGATVTPIVELAKVFSHKPTRVEYQVEEHDGQRVVTIDQNGTREGFLYEVVVADPEVDLRHHPRSRMARGEEMLATRDLPLRFLENVPAAGSAQLRIEEPIEG
jgi:hypothetical protein